MSILYTSFFNPELCAFQELHRVRLLSTARITPSLESLRTLLKMYSHHGNFSNEFQIKFLPPMFGVEFFVALLGNTFALWLLMTRERQNWHTGVVFSFNLAISDLLYVLSLPLLITYYARGKDWPFGETVCKMERFLFTCNLYVSIFFITCISVNRYVAIVHPFFTHSHVHPWHAKIAGLLVWILVMVISAPVLKFSSTCRAAKATECVSACNDINQLEHFTYSVFLAVFGCLLPFLVTLASYVAIFWVVWKNQNITAQEKRKVALLVASVLVLYAVSVVPYHVLRNYHLYLRLHSMNIPLVYNSYQVTKGLVTLNMCIHPVLYMAVFDSIRTFCCGRTSEDHHTNRPI